MYFISRVSELEAPGVNTRIILNEQYNSYIEISNRNFETDIFDKTTLLSIVEYQRLSRNSLDGKYHNFLFLTFKYSLNVSSFFQHNRAIFFKILKVFFCFFNITPVYIGRTDRTLSIIVLYIMFSSHDMNTSALHFIHLTIAVQSCE